MPDTSITSQLYRRFEARAVAKILNDQAMSVVKRIAYIQEGTLVIDEHRLKEALYAAYLETSRELRHLIKFDDRNRVS